MKNWRKLINFLISAAAALVVVVSEAMKRADQQTSHQIVYKQTNQPATVTH